MCTLLQKMEEFHQKYGGGTGFQDVRSDARKVGLGRGWGAHSDARKVGSWMGWMGVRMSAVMPERWDSGWG